MIKHKFILSLLLFVGISLSADSKEMTLSTNDFPIPNERQDDTTTLEVIINNTTKVKMENVPTTGYLEVYSILGVRVTSINLKTRLSECFIELPKGIYILKAGKVAQKIIVR